VVFLDFRPGSLAWRRGYRAGGGVARCCWAPGPPGWSAAAGGAVASSSRPGCPITRCSNGPRSAPTLPRIRACRKARGCAFALGLAPRGGPSPWCSGPGGVDVCRVASGPLPTRAFEIQAGPDNGPAGSSGAVDHDHLCGLLARRGPVPPRAGYGWEGRSPSGLKRRPPPAPPAAVSRRRGSATTRAL